MLNTKLREWMLRLGVQGGDCREQFLRSPGKGGQNVNKVETAVWLVHVPTGIGVKSHSERSQNANRLKAWELLLHKIEQQQKQATQAKIHDKEKLRRQKRKRSRQGKEKMLSDKKFKSEKKSQRSKNFVKKLFVAWIAFSVFGEFVLTAHFDAFLAKADEPLMVFAAASLEAPLKELANDFKKENKVDVVFNLGGSSSLRTQIEKGSPCDLFLAADKANTQHLLAKDLVDGYGTVNLLVNRLVVAANAEYSEEFNSLYDLRLSFGEHLAIADPQSAPAGISANQALAKAGLASAYKDYIVPTIDVDAALALVQKGSAKYAIVYATDVLFAKGAGKDIKTVYPIPTQLHDPIVYSGAVIKGERVNLARDFLAFLQTEHGKTVFIKYGFRPY